MQLSAIDAEFFEEIEDLKFRHAAAEASLAAKEKQVVALQIQAAAANRQ
jgi:hypothetical protein